MAVNSRKLIKLGSNVKRYRKENNLTQEQLATKVRVSSTYIGFIEQGQRNPSLKTLDKIARVLGVEMPELLK
ncbi:MAG: XRE family transcriptional regulator [uncultured bacterium]|nr:MAG: XRE family transcriptional regulator [uncultured bacterium]